MSSAEVHDLEARLGMDEAKRAVWADDDWAGGIDLCLDRLTPELAGLSVTRVLDYGCGMGRLMKPLLERYADPDDSWRITGYDPSVAMLDRAHEHVGRESGARFAIEPPDEMFDLAYSVCVLQHLPQQQQWDALAWLSAHARTVVVQFVTKAEFGPLSHPQSLPNVLSPLWDPTLAAYSVELAGPDDRFPTWAWATARYRR